MTKVTRIEIEAMENGESTEIKIPMPEFVPYNGYKYLPRLFSTHLIWNELIAIWVADTDYPPLGKID